MLIKVRNIQVFLATLFLGIIQLSFLSAHCQKEIKLPSALRANVQEFSGLAIGEGRLYLLPQYGGQFKSGLDGDFFLYSFSTDSIECLRKGEAFALAYRPIRVRNLNLLSDSIKRFYEGFEALTFIGNKVFLTIETADHYPYCFLISGQLDTATNEIAINPTSVQPLKRLVQIKNAGFESLTYLPQENKLLAIYEFNSNATQNQGYLIDTSLNLEPEPIGVPFAYFRITDITATEKGVYGLNYYWNGDFASYVNNSKVARKESIGDSIPDLQPYFAASGTYLQEARTCITRIVRIKDIREKKWEQVKLVESKCSAHNWEGIVPFGNGFLIISDANNFAGLKTTLLYIE